jgi:hypothetical protein
MRPITRSIRSQSGRRLVVLVLVMGALVAWSAPKRRAKAVPAAAVAPMPRPSSEDGPSPGPERAMQEAKARGDAAMLAGRPADALKDYDEALALKADPALFYNKARALQALERYPEALQFLETFAEKAAPELRARVPRLDALVTELRTRSSALEVRCGTSGAEVRVADTVVGTTPLTGRVVRNAGQVMVVVTHADHHRWERLIDLPPAGVAVIDVTLSPKATTGLLQVRASVPSASLAIDDRPRGTVPFEDYLPLGTHLVHVSAEGFEPVRSSVVIGSMPRLLELELQRTPRLHERWTFWVAIGAVVAAGVGVAVALVVERPPMAGSLGLSAVGR